MKVIKKLLIIFILIILAPILFFIIRSVFFYEYELNQIKSDLNKIESVSVIDIWGHNDLTLENIGARIKIEGKGEMVLLDLSSDANNYPNSVIISEIGGYKFKSFSCFDYENKGYHKGLGFAIDISKNSEIGKQIGIEFRNPKMVVDNYDKILKAVESLEKIPEFNYYRSKEREIYILVYRNDEDLKSIFDKYGVNNLADFQHTFNFKNPECK